MNIETTPVITDNNKEEAPEEGAKPKISINDELFMRADDYLDARAVISHPESESSYQLKDGIYSEVGFKAEVDLYAAEMLAGKSTQHTREELREHIRIKSTDLDPNRFIHLENLIVTDNIHYLTVDFDTGAVTDHENMCPDEGNPFIKIAASYDPGAKCPAFKAFINGAAHPKDLETLAEFVGYLLTPGNRRYQKALFLHGKTNTGKSTFLHCVIKLVGDHNVTSHTFQNLEKHKHISHQLQYRLINVCADIPSTVLRQSSFFKRVVGGDNITGEPKYGKAFSFYPSAKLAFSCNELPVIQNAGYAEYRRMIIASFDNEVPQDKIIPGFEKTLTTPAELSGILNWALAGLTRLIKRGRFEAGPPSELEADYLARSDPVRAFLSLHLKRVDHPEVTAKPDILHAYHDFCSDHGYTTAQSDNAFWTRLKRLVIAKGWEWKTVRPRRGKSRVHGLSRIVLGAPDPDDDDNEGGPPTLINSKLDEEGKEGGIGEGSFTPKVDHPSDVVPPGTGDTDKEPPDDPPQPAGDSPPLSSIDDTKHAQKIDSPIRSVAGDQGNRSQHKRIKSIKKLCLASDETWTDHALKEALTKTGYPAENFEADIERLSKKEGFLYRPKEGELRRT